MDSTESVVTAARQSRKGGRPSQDDAEQLADRIIDSATRLFLGDGFEATSLERIAREAGVSKRTLYSRFDSKSAVFTAVVARYTRRQLAEMPNLEEQGSASTMARLIQICMATLQIVLAADVIALERMVMAEAARFPELARIVHDFATSQLRAPMLNVLRDGVSRGDIRADNLDEMAELMADALISGSLRRAALGLEVAGLDVSKQARLERRLLMIMRGLSSD